jgi:hypothetical protein
MKKMKKENETTENLKQNESGELLRQIYYLISTYCIDDYMICKILDFSLEELNTLKANHSDIWDIAINTIRRQTINHAHKQLINDELNRIKEERQEVWLKKNIRKVFLEETKK